MSYRMAGGVFGELQNSFDREDAAYADKYKTDLSTALANRNAYAAAQQEALRQAQLAEAYDFQDLQNQQIQKQRALENAMGGRRQLQHEYEFGEKMKSEAAANKLWQENERLRIGEQKAREADRMAQQESKEFLRLLDYSKNPQASYSDFTSAYDEMPYLQGDRWQKLMSNLQETQKEVAALDQARARQAEYWSQMALDASRAPLTPEAKQKAVNDFYAPIMKSKGFHENFYIDDDWTVKPLPVRRPTDALPAEADRLAARGFFERGNSVPQAAPRFRVSPEDPQFPVQLPQAAPRAAAPEQGRSMLDLAAPALLGNNPAQATFEALNWARDQQRRAGLKAAAESISSGSRGIPGTSGEPGPSAIPEPDLSEQLRSVRAQIAASPNYRPDLSAERNRLMAELYARNQRDTAGRPPVGLVDNSLDDYKRDYWLDLFAKAAFQGVGTGVQEARDALYEQMPRDRERLDEARRRQFNRWRTSSGLSPVLRHSPPAGPVTPRDIYPFQNPSAPETLFELATLPDLAR